MKVAIAAYSVAAKYLPCASCCCAGSKIFEVLQVFFVIRISQKSKNFKQTAACNVIAACAAVAACVVVAAAAAIVLLLLGVFSYCLRQLMQF